MKLVSSASGWALTGNRLLWTSDNGQSWDDITPAIDQQQIRTVFFLDTKTGWAILSENDSAASITVASTANAGRSWQSSPVALNAIAQGRQFAAASSVYFADAKHGWLILRFRSSSNFSVGAALSTVDGGLTWTALPSPPAAGTIVFTSTQNGSLTGGPAQDQLWLTTNGGQSWQAASVSKNAAVASTGTQASQLSVSGTIISLQRSGVISQGALPAGLRPNGKVTHTEFVDNSKGWLIYSTGQCSASKSNCSQQNELLATADGGKTYTVITPHPSLSTNASLPLSRNSLSSLQLSTTAQNAATPEAAFGSNAVVSQSSGIDLACAPSSANLQTWWSDSPYSDIGIYLGGCDVYCVATHGPDICNASQKSTTTKTVDSNLTSSWVTSVTKMGWGLIPIWVGPQSPCIANASSYWVITPSDTNSTGAFQADEAVTEANALGLTNGIIYYDMEGYTSDGGTCSSTVETFLNDWTTELHAKGFESGLYGGIGDFETDFLALSPEPDVAWIAAWDSNNTVLNLGTLPDSDWPTNQRIHQWNSEDGGETWGGVNLGGMDQNIVDAPVIGNWTATSPSFALSNSGSIAVTTLGTPATSTITVTPSNGFTGVVNLSCSISPAASVTPTCSLPATVTISGTTASTATLTINTTAGTKASNSPKHNFFLAGSGSALACLLLFAIPIRRRGWQNILGVILLAVSIATVTGCGGGSGGSTGGGGTTTGATTKGTYTVTVIGVDNATGTVKSLASVTATVN